MRQATGEWTGLPVCDAEEQSQIACSIEHVVAWSTGQVETSAQGDADWPIARVKLEPGSHVNAGRQEIIPLMSQHVDP